MAILLEIFRPAVVLVVGLVVFGVVERVARGDGRGPPWRRAGFWTDAGWWMITPLVTRSVTRLGVGIAVFLIAWATLGRRIEGDALRVFIERATWASRLPLPIEILLTLGAADLVGYWTHRAFHRGWLWRTHAVHHSSARLDWLAAVRVHPLNDLMGGVTRVAILVGAGFRPTVLAGVVPFLTIYALLLHANVRWTFGPLRRFVASPMFHRFHHARDVAGDGVNFAGFFAFWDVVFGTFHLPEGAEPPETGVKEPIPTGIVGQLLHPFRRS